MISKLEFINKMNEYGRLRLPFLFIIDYQFESPIIFPLDILNSDLISYKTPKYTNSDDKYENIDKFHFQKVGIDYNRYKIAFEYVKDNIINGNSYLLNLTFPSKIFTNLTLRQIFQHSNAMYKIYYNDEFVCFSPETFVKIKDRKIFSYPMKGTIDASIENALEIIMNDEKEFAEHNTIVDLIRNDLSIVSKNVRVTKFRYADYLKTNNKNLIQISSEICGDLQSDYIDNLGNIIEKLLPAGSVTGAPKSKTLEIIEKSEQYERGYYTGVFGIFDGKDLDSAVMIRFIEQCQDGLVFKSGGGITALSELKSEYKELIDKVYVPIY